MVLEGWKKKRNTEEVDLIADYEMEWGQPDHWPDEIIKEFDDKWDAIQEKYNEYM